MKDILIKVSRETRMVDLTKSVIGNESENLQGNLIFSFTDEFVNGQARIEYEMNGEKHYQNLTKKEENYTIPIKNALTKKGQIDMQLVITEGTDEDEIPVFKSNVFYLICNGSINAEIEQPDEYEQWIEIANTKLNQVDNLDIDLDNNILTITKKDGTIKSENVKGEDGYTPVKGIDYFDGIDGKDYVITDEDYDVIEKQVKTDIQPILEEIENVSKQAEIIAKGRATGYVFDTLEDLDKWLSVSENTSKLVLGDNLYIRTVGVPDYWWDGTSKQVLETEKPDLTEYAKKEQFVTLTQAEYDSLTEKSANTYYFIIEEE